MKYVVTNMNTEAVLSPEMTLMEALGYMQAWVDFGHGTHEEVAAVLVQTPQEVNGL